MEARTATNQRFSRNVKENSFPYRKKLQGNTIAKRRDKNISPENLNHKPLVTGISNMN